MAGQVPFPFNFWRRNVGKVKVIVTLLAVLFIGVFVAGVSFIQRENQRRDWLPLGCGGSWWQTKLSDEGAYLYEDSETGTRYLAVKNCGIIKVESKPK